MNMSANFKSIKDVKKKSKLTVFGYIHEMEKIFAESSAQHYNQNNTPFLVCYLIILYYNNTEYFTKHGKDVIITEKCDEISVDLYKDGTAYGNRMINQTDCHIYIWTFKVLESDDGFIGIGIDSSDKKHINTDFYSVLSKNKYFHYAYGTCHESGAVYSLYNNSYKYGRKVRKGDVIKMKLNTFSRSIMYWHNGWSQGVAFQGVNFRKNRVYHLAVYLNHGQKVKLLDFKQIFRD